MVGQQVHHRLELALLLDVDRLGHRIALLDRLGVGQERRQVVVVGLEGLVLETVGHLQPLPPAELAVLGDQRQRRVLQVGKALVALAGVGHQRLRVLLEHRRHHHRGHRVLDVVEAVQQVAGHQEVDAPGRQQRPVVDLRPARLDGHVQAVLLVGAVGHRLVEAAVRGLGLPVGGESDLLLRQRRGLHGEGQQGGGGQQEQAWAHG